MQVRNNRSARCFLLVLGQSKKGGAGNFGGGGDSGCGRDLNDTQSAT